MLSSEVLDPDFRTAVDPISLGRVITHIKIFGERNSGTRVIEQLLRLNLQKVRYCGWLYSGKSGWKHGFPRISKCEHVYKSTLFIFIYRDMEPWLKSMFRNRYHFEFQGDFDEFVNGHVINQDRRPDHDVLVYPEERGNLVDIRNRKFLMAKRFISQVPNALMLNLEDIQTRPQEVIKFISKTFRIPTNPKFRNVHRHTKCMVLGLKNRVYEGISFEYLQVLNRNRDIEDYIEGLKNGRFMYVRSGTSFKVK